MRFIATSLLVLLVLVSPVLPAQEQSPTGVALRFYRLLKEKKYVDGFRDSIYRDAVEGLSAGELKDLEPEFARTFSNIPDRIEARGEQVSGSTATVYLKFGDAEEPQPVALVKAGGKWLVGDQESLAVVKAQGRSFFFNARMTVAEQEAATMLSRLVGAEFLYARKNDGLYGTVEELVRLDGVPKDILEKESGGYVFKFSISSDRRSYNATAVPADYGRTGRLSFYADTTGIRAEDRKGKAASAGSPPYQIGQ